ncbi:MAG: 3-oxoacyl-(acyl-carrier-protein) synthase 3 [Chloroflexi bacterium]|nr:3-oxoacyl-(acyl-carrier-protein) synthase 3 [Chloroflexota bacterium]
MNRFARIRGVGMYLPERKVTNEELGRMMECDVDEYLRDKGIKVRYQSAPDEAVSDMSVKAARDALVRAGMEPEDIDLIILATDTPDYVSPPTSAIIQHKLGAKNAGSFDINAACADETIALALGSHYIMLDAEIKNVLVIGAYGMTKWLDWSNYSESVSKVLGMLFGDGAGAVILTDSVEPGYLTSKTYTEGNFWDAYGIYLGTAKPPDARMIEEKKHLLRFHDNRHRIPPDFNIVRWPKLIRETVEKAGCKVEDLSLVLMNQVELDAVKGTMKELGLPMAKTHWIADKFGYAGSASAFMALHDALEQKKIEDGDLLVFCTSGAGFVLSAALFRWA